VKGNITVGNKDRQAFRSRIVGEGNEAPDQLLANPLNWRVHPKEQVDALEGLLSQVGWVQRVIVNKRTGNVVDGHARVALALRRGEAALPVLYVDLSEEEERLVLAAIDPIGGMAGRDDDMLAQLLDGLQAEDAGLQALLDSLKNEAPNFEPGTEEDQSRLDQKKPTVCPSCGHEF
jgi:ParB-like chromosome segregation protein Spo0J